MNYSVAKLQSTLLRDVSLARFTTWGIGGSAEYYYKPNNLIDLQYFLSAKKLAYPITWLGLGSNVLIPETGIAGTVIHTHKVLSNITLQPEKGLMKVEAGVTCAKIAKYCLNNKLAGGIFFAGIPGTLGGALAMNAGAFGHETWNYVQNVTTIDQHGILHTRAKKEFQISYRKVITMPNEWFVAATLKFPLSSRVKIDAIKTLLQQRKNSQPIGLRSCGSVFKNPGSRFAAQLIESIGLKGYCWGGAAVSTKHANFIINNGNACANDILTIVKHIKSNIYDTYKIKLEEEFVILGE